MYRDRGNEFNIHLELMSNGWVEVEEGEPNYEEDLSKYKLRILGNDYYSDVYAVIADKLDNSIGWLEARYEYPDTYALSTNDIEDIRSAINQAENILLKLEIPFAKKSGYTFLEENDRKHEINKLIRKKWEIDD